MLNIYIYTYNITLPDHQTPEISGAAGPAAAELPLCGAGGPQRHGPTGPARLGRNCGDRDIGKQ